MSPLEAREQRRLLRFLHDLGTVLNFDDPESPYQVGDTNILNPEWVTVGVYKIINNNALAQAQGKLEVSRLHEILDDETRYPRDKQRFVVEMMRKFASCKRSRISPLARSRWVPPCSSPSSRSSTWVASPER